MLGPYGHDYSNNYICKIPPDFIQVKNANAILDQSNQPYHYLIESVRVRDTQINKQKEHIAVLEGDVR